ncbi:MAG TPA: hypothetical protein VKX96_06385 [Chloroflexota bacterium]|nr:hypothetical protein [Chloroflexota bacterium]
MTHDCDQFAVAATSSRLWRPGDIIYSGQVIGATIHGGFPVRSHRTVRVTKIQYDIDSAAVILQVEPATHWSPGKRSRSINRGARLSRARTQNR